MLRSYLLLMLVILPLLSSQAQTGEELPSLSSRGGKVIVRPSAPPAEEMINDAPPPSLEEDDDVTELESSREKKLEQIKMIEQSTEKLKNPLGNPLARAEILGAKDLSAIKLMDQEVVAQLQTLLKESTFFEIPPDEMRSLIEQKIKGHFLEDLFAKFPKLLDISVDIARSKEALSGLLGIWARREDLKTFGYTWLAIIVFSALIKRRIIKPTWSFFRRLRWGLSFTFILTGLNVLVFYQLFSIEIDPVLEIVKKHLF